MENISNAELTQVLKFCFDIEKSEIGNCCDCPVREISRRLDVDCEKILIGEVIKRLPEMECVY